MAHTTGMKVDSMSCGDFSEVFIKLFGFSLQGFGKGSFNFSDSMLDMEKS